MEVLVGSPTVDGIIIATVNQIHPDRLPATRTQISMLMYGLQKTNRKTPTLIFGGGGWNDSFCYTLQPALCLGCGNNIAVNSQGFDVGGYAMTEKTRRAKFALFHAFGQALINQLT